MPATTDEISESLGLHKQNRSFRRVAIAILALSVIAVAGWVWLGQAADRPEMRFVTATVEQNGFDVIVTATGTVEPTNLVEISSEASGTLAEVLVDYNDPVEVGTVLARLDDRRLQSELDVARAALDAASARVARARATLQEARERVEVARNLDERGVSPHLDLISREAAFAAARADLQSAEADQALAEATVDLRQTDLDRTCICSPINGVVLDRDADPGQIVAATLQAPILFTVAEDLTQMQLQVDVDEADVGTVRVGQEATFVVDAYDDEIFPATISEVRFAPETVDGVVTYKAILTIDNSEMLLRPGMTATADIVVQVVADALVVPNSALRFRPRVEETSAGDERSGLLGMLIPDTEQRSFDPNAAPTVWILDEAGMPQEVAVETGGTNGRLTAVHGDALTEGVEVIVEQIDG